MRYLLAIVLLAGCTSGTTELPVPEVAAAMGIALEPTSTPDATDDCDRCWGKGEIPFEDTGRMITCPDCNGTGLKSTQPQVDDALDTVPKPGASPVSPSATEPAESPAIAAIPTDGGGAGLLLDQGDCCAVLEKLINKETKTYDGIQWVGEAEARMLSDAGQWVVIYLTGNSCSRCIEMKRYVFTDPSFIAATKGYVFCEIKNDGNRWGIDRYPGIVLMAPGRIISRRSYPAATVEGMTYLFERFDELKFYQGK